MVGWELLKVKSAVSLKSINKKLPSLADLGIPALSLAELIIFCNDSDFWSQIPQKILQAASVLWSL